MGPLDPWKFLTESFLGETKNQTKSLYGALKPLESSKVYWKRPFFEATQLFDKA